MPSNLQKDCIIYFFSDLILDPEGAKGEIFKSDDDEAYLIASNKMESPADARKSEAMRMYIEVRGGEYLCVSLKTLPSVYIGNRIECQCSVLRN